MWAMSMDLPIEKIKKNLKRCGYEYRFFLFEMSIPIFKKSLHYPNQKLEYI